MIENLILESVKIMYREYIKLPFLPRTLVSIVAVSFLFSIVILGLYFYSTGNLSHKPEDWGYFGSLLSGIFTLTGTFAALATLVVLQHQMKQQQAINAKQIESIEFEKYDKHKIYFNNRLDDIERTYNNDISFMSREDLYLKLFPKNNFFETSHPITTKTDLESPELIADGNFGNVINKAEILANSRKLEATTTDISFIFDVFEIYRHLNIVFKNQNNDGMITYDNKTVGLNINALTEDFNRLSDILESLAIFCGNRIEVKLRHAFAPEPLKLNLIKQLKEEKTSVALFNLHYSDKNTDAISKAFSISAKHQLVLSETYSMLSLIFMSNTIGLSETDYKDVKNRIWEDYERNMDKLPTDYYPFFLSLAN